MYKSLSFAKKRIWIVTQRLLKPQTKIWGSKPIDKDLCRGIRGELRDSDAAGYVPHLPRISWLLLPVISHCYIS
jgi:hypothetical protein